MKMIECCRRVMSPRYLPVATSHLPFMGSRGISFVCCTRKPLAIQGAFIKPSPASSGITKLRMGNKKSTLSQFRCFSTTHPLAIFQPLLDIKHILNNMDSYQKSVTERKLVNCKLEEIQSTFASFEDAKKKLEHAETLREENRALTSELFDKLKDQKDKEGNDDVIKLKKKGRQLRTEFNAANKELNDLTETLKELGFSVPNTLDPKTPLREPELLRLTTPPPGVPLWNFPEFKSLTSVSTDMGFSQGIKASLEDSATKELELCDLAQDHLLKAGYVETESVDMVKRIILQAAWIDPRQFYRVREEGMKGGNSQTAYLTGSASFSSLLAMLSQTMVENWRVFPLRYFVIGKNYNQLRYKPGEHQRQIVHILVACRDEAQMEQEFERLTEVAETFYSTKVGIPSFQTQLINSTRLENYERKKLEFVIDGNGKTDSKVIGTLSTCGDYISKRILACYVDEERNPKFMHLLSCVFFDVTYFLQPVSSDTKAPLEQQSSATFKEDLKIYI